jgi:hypothetical protein
MTAQAGTNPAPAPFLGRHAHGVSAQPEDRDGFRAAFCRLHIGVQPSRVWHLQLVSAAPHSESGTGSLQAAACNGHKLSGSIAGGAGAIDYTGARYRSDLQ